MSFMCGRHGNGVEWYEGQDAVWGSLDVMIFLTSLPLAAEWEEKHFNFSPLW